MTASPQRPWNFGFTLLLMASSIGLVSTLFDLQLWAKAAVVFAIIACVFFGLRLLFRRKGD
ncbi:hypothetical protein [Salinibacterium sp. PAMC 21357]|uniref:hypothetical protein n=1 Tax=Salinibacterium sp. PAMC 21357 TaxID=1112215 RepID=UPI000289AECF|nr:hypothetical protein [Salinibacterium sp. PAMC 21357]